LPSNHTVYKYFKDLDEYISWFISKNANKADVIFLSDHGFHSYEGTFYLNEWLRKEGNLVLKEASESFSEKHMVAEQNENAWKKAKKRIRLPFFVRKMVVQNDRIKKIVLIVYKYLRDKINIQLRVEMEPDFSRSTAYCTTTESNAIYLNMNERFENGIVSKEEYPKLRNNIIEKLRKLNDDQGRPVFKGVFTKEEIYNGRCLRSAPDIILELNNHVISASFRFEIMDKVKLNYHHSEGMFFGIGPNFKENELILDSSILDIAPTILYLLKQKIPAHMDGNVLTATLKEEFVKKNQLQYTANVAGHPDNHQPIEDDEVIERLKSLGYLS
jgi:predicted AlkP superfamily phosphohydrolase/phosphomutase